jgi:hypothetical protein
VLIDLHLFLGDNDPLQLAEQVKRTVLDGVCLVDFKRLPSPEAVAKVRESGVKVFVGSVMPLDKGQVVVFPATEDFDWDAFINAAPEGTELVAYAGGKGCAVVACHPYHKETEAAMGDRILSLHGLDAVVAVTAASPVSANDLAVDTLDTLGIAAVGGTGGTTPVGKAATMFAAAFDTQARFVEELKKRDCCAAAVGPDDRWSSVEGAPRYGGQDRGHDRGGRDRGRGGRDRGGRDRGPRGGDRGGRDRGGRGGPRGGDRGGRDRGGRDRGGRDRGGRDRGWGRGGSDRGPGGERRPEGERSEPNGNVALPPGEGGGGYDEGGSFNPGNDSSID